VETALYKWILGANEKREDLSLPPGLIEESISQLLLLLGRDYLDDLLAWKIHDFRGTKGLAMVQNRCLCGFETKSEAFA